MTSWAMRSPSWRSITSPGWPITDNGRLVGILTNRDLRFQDDLEQEVRALMTPMPLITASVGITLDEARAILHRHRIEKLPIVDAAGMLKGLITVKDIDKKLRFPHATKDRRGRLRVTAAVGVGEEGLERAEALVGAGGGRARGGRGPRPYCRGDGDGPGVEAPLRRS